MEPRRTSALIGWGFFFSLLTYGTFLATVIMTSIFMMVDRDRALVGVTGIDPHDLKELLFAIHVTSTVGLGLSVLPIAMCVGGCFVVLGDRLRKKGLSLAAVAVTLALVSAGAQAFVVCRNPATRIGQSGAPFELSVSATEVRGKKYGDPGTLHVAVHAHATRGTLDPARDYTYLLLASSRFYGYPRQVFDITSEMVAAIPSGKESTTARIPGLQLKDAVNYQFYVIAQPTGKRTSCEEEVVSTEVYAQSSDHEPEDR